jgi:hypothetical protein
MKKSTARTKVTKLSQYRNGRDANGLAEFPLALLTDKAPPGAKTLEFEDTITDWSTGKEVRQRVCITGSDKFGLPTPKDEDVLLALLQLTKIANNFTSPEVCFTKRQVIEILGWENRGWAYDRVEESLHRWKGVSIHYWNAWRDKSRGTWCDSEAIGVIEYLRITDGRRRDIANDAERLSRITWNKALFESFQAGYLKPLDFETYRKLDRPAAKRAYRFFDKRFHHKPLWEYELRQLACERLGFSRNYDTGQLKERLKPALGELEQIGFIEPVKYRKERSKIWKIAIAKKGTVSDAGQPIATTSGDSLVAMLVQRGVAKETAMELVTSNSAELICEKLRLFAWLVSRNDKRISKNAPGWLATAIRQNYSPPRDYVRVMNHSTSKRPSGSKPSRNPVSVPPAGVPENEDDAAKRAMEDYLASLSEEELLKLEEAALAKADTVLVDGYQRSKATSSPAHTAYRRMLLEREAKTHLAELLRKVG